MMLSFWDQGMAGQGWAFFSGPHSSCNIAALGESLKGDGREDDAILASQVFAWLLARIQVGLRLSFFLCAGTGHFHVCPW